MPRGISPRLKERNAASCPASRNLFGRLRKGVALWQQRGAEVHAGEIRPGKIRFAQDRDTHVRAGETCAMHIGLAQIDIPQLRALEIYVGKIAAEKFDA